MSLLDNQRDADGHAAKIYGNIVILGWRYKGERIALTLH